MAAAPQFSTDYSSLLAGLPTGGTDYSGLLQSILTPGIQALNAQSNNYWTQLGNQYGNAIANYGAYPTDLQFGDPNYSTFITPEVQALADAATRSGVSTTAQLSHAYDLAGQHSTGSLAARNLIRSGALGQHLNENLQNYNVAGYGARQGLLGNLGNYYSQYLGNESGLNSQYANYVQNALSTLLALIGMGGYGRGGGGGGGGGAPTQQSGLSGIDYSSHPEIFPQGTNSNVYISGPQNQGLNNPNPPANYTDYSATAAYNPGPMAAPYTSATANPDNALAYRPPRQQPGGGI